jgi:hypothetical protein
MGRKSGFTEDNPISREQSMAVVSPMGGLQDEAL